MSAPAVVVLTPDEVRALVDHAVRTALAAVGAAPTQTWVSQGEAARRLQCDRSTIYRRISSGDIPPDAVRMFGSRAKISAKWLMQQVAP